MVDGGFAEVPGGWRYMLGVAAVPAAMQFVGVLFLPESPRWLVAKGRVEEAREVLGRLRASEDIGFEMAEIEEDVAATSSLPTAGLKDLWASPPIRRAVILGCGLMLLQQLSGINTVMYYSASIYNMAGFSDTASIWLAGFTALAQFVGMLANMALVEKWGRRTLVLTSLSLVTVSLVAIGASFYLAMASSAAVKVVDPMCATVSNMFIGSFGVTTCFQCVENAACGFCPSLQACMPGNKTMDTMGTCPVSSGGGRGMEGGWAYGVCENEYGYLSVASMVLYLFTFGLGMGAMPWTICAEIFPLHVRSLANSLTTSVNWVGNVVISATFLTVASPHVLTQYGAFWLYALIAFSGLVGLSFTLPETKGVPLEEIEALFIRPGDRIPGMEEEEELTGGAREKRRMSAQSAVVEGGGGGGKGGGGGGFFYGNWEGGKGDAGRGSGARWEGRVTRTAAILQQPLMGAGVCNSGYDSGGGRGKSKAGEQTVCVEQAREEGAGVLGAVALPCSSAREMPDLEVGDIGGAMQIIALNTDNSQIFCCRNLDADSLMQNP